LNFRLSAGDLGDRKTEYGRYNNELNTISKYHAEMSEMGQEIAKWKGAFKVDILFFGSFCGCSSISTTLQPFVLAVGTSFVPVDILDGDNQSASTTLQPFVLAVGTSFAPVGD
jgi:hypothetical protein